MTVNYIKKIWKRVDKVLPGASDYIDPVQVLGLSKKDQKALNFAAGIFLAAEKSEKVKSGKRMQFSQKTKLLVLKAQNYRCKLCKAKLGEADFDHIDENRANNSLSNCQALCPNCHATKTRKKKLF